MFSSSQNEPLLFVYIIGQPCWITMFLHEPRVNKLNRFCVFGEKPIATMWHTLRELLCWLKKKKNFHYFSLCWSWSDLKELLLNILKYQPVDPARPVLCGLCNPMSISGTVLWLKSTTVDPKDVCRERVRRSWLNITQERVWKTLTHTHSNSHTQVCAAAQG